ncbi:hypothetical protein RMATCC62417_11384 [Rhizopus microsporus]|nr:hypothetical protein RMATCC62417_11384 [Rhizopus microsporus]
MKKRLRWVHEHIDWADGQWSSVIWNDESRFTVFDNDDGARVTRKVSERYDAKHTVPTKKYGGGGVMVWSCFHPKNSIPGSRNSANNRKRTLYSKRMKLAATTGGYARWWKKTHQIRGYEYWPAQNPDLNPIEHVWAALGNLIKERRSEIRNAEELSAVLREEWEKINPGLATCLVESIRLD